MSKSQAVVVQGEDDEEEEDTTFLALQPTLAAASAANASAVPSSPSKPLEFLADAPSAVAAELPATLITASTASASPATPPPSQAARSQLERQMREKNARVRDVTCARTSAFYVGVNKELHRAHQRLGKSLAAVQDALNTSAGVAQSLTALNQKLAGLEPLL